MRFILNAKETRDTFHQRTVCDEDNRNAADDERDEWINTESWSWWGKVPLA